MNEIKKGIIASEGIALGKVLLLEKAEIEITDKKIKDSQREEEIIKFKNALLEYNNDLKNAKVENEIQKEVIKAHIGMLEDPFLEESVLNKINEQNLFAIKALSDAIDDMISTMELMEDDYMKERAVDYKDIGQRLIYKLAEREPINLENLKENSIIVSKELTPSDTSTMDRKKVVGFAMDLGGKTAHTSIIAQTLGIPAIVGMKDISKIVKNGDFIILDALKGEVILNPSNELKDSYIKKKKKIEEEKIRLEKNKYKESVTKDGHKVEVACNIGNISDLELGLANGAEGVGLFRTEFLYMDSNDFPTEDEQFEVYKKAALLLDGKPLIIRTLDIGGDKSLPYYKFPEEENPFLGWRALRISFDLPEVFETQIRAILKASAFGKVRILLPMVISIEEILKARDIIDNIKNDLIKEGIKFDEYIEIGIMIETPASVIISENLIKYVDYFSIGTNDLTQYILAVDRGNEKISELYNSYNPAVLRMIKKVIDDSHNAGKWTGMCGGFAGDTKATKLLLGLGLDEFSAAASSLPKIKDIIINTKFEDAKIYANRLLELETTIDIENNL